MEFCNNFQRPLTRREMLKASSAGIGGLALASLLGDEALADPVGGPLSPKLTEFAPKAKRVIFLFMHGGPSQMDTFDYKPLLHRDHGKPYPFQKPRVQFERTGNLMRGDWEFKQYGDSGAWVSELLPNIAEVVDDLCFVKSLCESNPAHGGALLKMHTGSDTFVRPSMGSWVTYGLGSENQNLPGFITICPSLSHGGVNNWSSAFLPAPYHGTPVGNSRVKASEATINYLANESTDPAVQREKLAMIEHMNEGMLELTGPDQALEGRIKSFELAFRMQTEAPEIISIDGESEATRKLYGLDDPLTEDFGRQCLLARRFSERGVRFVQATERGWDHHSNLFQDLPGRCNGIDKPVAGLIKDLKSRGMLEETLVLWGGEFGRTPGSESTADLKPQSERRDGRDHNPHGFTMFMAGGGVKPGLSYGATDDYGYYAVENRVPIHDLHATMLHLLGINHLNLTHRYQGRDFRLTDVAGNVVHDIIA